MRFAVAAAMAIILVLAHGGAVAQFGDWPDIFDPNQLLDLHLEMDAADWATLQNDESLSIEVPALFHADGESAILVSVRRKSGDPLNEAPGYTKVSLKIDINDFVTGQSWHGLKKLSLENGDDEDVAAEGVAWQIERLASATQGYGYPVGHASWVRLFINGMNTGVYLSVEQVDKRFLENRGFFVQGQTWLYKVSDIGTHELKVGGPQDSPTVDALCYSPFDSDPSCPTPDLATDVPLHVDMKGLLTEFASDNFQANGDALISKGKNYYFSDSLGELRKYFPWDRDSSMPGGNVSHGMYVGSSGFEVLLDVPEFRAQYSQILNGLVCGPWSEASLLAVVDAVEPALTGALAADPNFPEDPTERFESLRNCLSQRVANVIAQIEGFQPCPTVQLALNEFMASNAVFLEDPDEPGEFPDWLELKNLAGSAVDLGGLYLTDNLAQPTKYQIPSGVTIPANGHIIFYADEDPEQGPLHTTFRLAAGGEVVAIYDTDGVQQIDSISFGGQFADISFGRFPDGTGSWGFMSTPTPVAVNTPHNAPPVIQSVLRTPELPTAADNVVISAHVSDDTAVTDVTLHYDAGIGWVALTMQDDGLSGDGAAGDLVYGAEIPSHATDTIVDYYLTATDDLGTGAESPVNAPTLTYTYVVDYLPPALHINEFMADNDAVIEDPDEPLAYEDWFEIFNPGASDVDLGGMYVTDDLAIPTKFPIAAGVIVPAGGYLLFWADGEIFQGPTHTNFKLSSAGEQIGLFDADARGNVAIDTVTFTAQLTDVSEGRCPDGGAVWQLFGVSTPAASNQPCSSGPEACCLPGGTCQEVEVGQCAISGGAPQGTGSTCATAICPECVGDEDCDDGVFCTLGTCDPVIHVCLQIPFDIVCNDGLFCNGSESCDPFADCVPGPPPCQEDMCDEEVDECIVPAGRVPDGTFLPGVPLTLAKEGDEVTLSWGVSCALSDTDFSVHEGTVGNYYSHEYLFCWNGGAQSVTLTPSVGDRYFVVVPNNAWVEGSFGRDGFGFERPPSVPSCADQWVGSCR